MIVYNAYGMKFTYPKLALHFYPLISCIALLLALLCAVVPAYLVANRTLREKPAALLQPKPPEAGGGDHAGADSPGVESNELYPQGHGAEYLPL